MYDHDFNLVTHCYTNAFNYEVDLIIIQFHFVDKVFELIFNDKSKEIEIFIIYDSFTFSSIQRKYFIYKKELCSLIKFVIKYNYFNKNSRLIIFIHIDHKSLIHFFKSDFYENIYEHWTDKLRRLCVTIKYIFERKNKMTNELFKTIVKTFKCHTNEIMEKFLNRIINENISWMWKNEKYEYEIFFIFLNSKNRNEIVENDIFHEVEIFDD